MIKLWANKRADFLREARGSGKRSEHKYIVYSAEDTGLPDGSFDAITAAQCFWYFDREKMRSEIRRLLRPRGKFIKIFMNWDSEDPIASKSVALVERYNPKWSEH